MSFLNRKAILIYNYLYIFHKYKMRSLSASSTNLYQKSRESMNSKFKE